jgi:hypothetical protein
MAVSQRPMRRRGTKSGKRTKGRDMSMSVYAGQLKIRELWLRAGILIQRIEGVEMRELLKDAKAEYEVNGVIPVNMEIKLSSSGHTIDNLKELWDITADLANDESPPSADDAPLNTFS